MMIRVTCPGGTQNHILPALLLRASGYCPAGEDDFGCAQLTGDIELPAVEKLEMDGVHVNRVGIDCGVCNFPDFNAAVYGVFRDGLHASLAR